jgi:hypothetical protein
MFVLSWPLFAQESKPTEPAKQPAQRDSAQAGNAWTRIQKDRTERGTLHDSYQYVRGDSGKWNDEPILQHVPSLGRKPAKTTLDDWADQWLERDFRPTTVDENWLIFRTKQLDDNDRVWIERIERRGNQFVIVMNNAIWQGRYFKTFTYYSVFGVNLGKLEPGTYAAKGIVKPLKFTRFDGDGRPNENWPQEERPTKENPTELQITFEVVAPDDSSSD